MKGVSFRLVYRALWDSAALEITRHLDASGALNYYNNTIILRTAKLEGTLQIMESRPCQSGTVGNQTANLWPCGWIPQPLS